VFTPRGVIEYFGFLQTYDSSTLLGGISAAWSLCVEAAFYVMLPLWAMLLRRFSASSSRRFLRSELLGLAVLFAIGVVWTAVGGANAHPTSAIFFDVTRLKTFLFVLPSFLDQLALGMGLAVLSVAFKERSSWPAFMRTVDRAPWIPWLVAAIAFVTVAQTPRWFADDYGVRFFANHELQAVIALALVTPVVFGDQRRGLGRRLLANRALIFLGVVSYSFYLWHVAVISELTRLKAQSVLGAVGFSVAAFGLSLAIGSTSFYAIERPALRLARRLTPGRDSQDADVRARDLARRA
jgi:peptidoglycan/LPS O-acetylase OafA/YrhL